MISRIRSLANASLGSTTMHAPALLALALAATSARAQDGGPVDGGQPGVQLPIISEVAWMGGTTSANDEWVELANPTGDAIASLADFVLVEGATSHPLPDVPLPAYGVVVLERAAGATSLNAPDAVVVAFTGGLLNSGEILRLCRVDDALVCDVANTGAAWHAGSNNAPKRTMVRRRSDLDGALAASWVTFDGAPSVVTDSGAVAFNGSPGVFDEEPVDPPPEDAGVVDAGPLPYQPLPVITEVAWMGASSANDEWIEIVNGSELPIVDLSEFVVVEGATQHALPPVALAAGGVLVLERSATATSLAAPDAVVLAFTSGLSNSGEILRLCRAPDLTECDAANPAGGAWFAGDNDAPKKTMTRRGLLLDGALASSWKDHDDVPSAVTDSAGVGIGGSPGVFVDDSPPPPPDGGVLDAGPPPFQPLPVVSEVAWMGSTTEANDEWIELYNIGPDPIVDLSAFVLVEGTTTHALPSVEVGRDQVVVLERSAAATSLEPPQAVVVPFSSGLSNTGEALSVCRADDLADCDVANPGGAWYAGSNGTGTQPKASMVRVSAEYPGALASSWTSHTGPLSLITDSAGVGIPGTPGSAIFPDVTDGGIIIVDDGGFEPFDAGPNESPTIVVHEPSGTVTSETVAITWDAFDDDGDPLEVALYYATDDQGFEGVLISRGHPGGEGQGATWTTTGVASGTWRVFAKVTDPRGAVQYAFAPGQVVVEGSAGEASISLIEPDGVNDVVENGAFTIEWSVELPGGAEGLVSLYADTDDTGEDGVPIASGLDPATTTSFTWLTDGFEPGSYAIYGVLDWTQGREVSYGGFVDVGTNSCACVTSRTTSGGGVNLPLWWGIAILVAARHRRRRR